VVVGDTQIGGCDSCILVGDASGHVGVGGDGWAMVGNGGGQWWWAGGDEPLDYQTLGLSIHYLWR
jgi:hypothetical protein